MPIRFRKYVNLKSAVGGVSAVQTTELITRIFSINPLIPSGGIALEFTSSIDVGNYFGQVSEEYLRSAFYFNWISKTFTRPQKISYSYWAKTASFPLIYGANLTSIGTTLISLQAITSGHFTLNIGGVSHTLTGLNFSSASTFANVATIIEAAINAESGTQWTAATVTYSSSANAFNFVGGDDSVAAVISTGPVSQPNDITALIGWLSAAIIYPSAPIFSNGVQIESITTTLTNSADLSDNFGSYLFTNQAALSQSQIVESANWNLEQNNEFQFMIQTSAGNSSAYSTALASIGGSNLTLSPITTEYPEMIPGMILAATNYNNANVSQNYMFQQNFNLTPSVTTTADADTYDALRINYFGQTQTAGQLLSFYQNGVMTGANVTTNPLDMNVYANEQWFKNAAAAANGNLLLGATQVSANDQGRSQVLTTLQSGPVNQATINGVISVGSLLTQDQIATVGEITNDPDAWRQVQSIGYWLDAVVIFEDPDYIIQYTFVYKKNDSIRKIEGLNVLI